RRRHLGGGPRGGARRRARSVLDRRRRGGRDAARLLRPPAHAAVGPRALPPLPGLRRVEAARHPSPPGAARRLRGRRGRPRGGGLREPPGPPAAPRLVPFQLTPAGAFDGSGYSILQGPASSILARLVGTALAWPASS